MSMLEQALQYAEGGFSVFPVCSPTTDGKQCLEGHGNGFCSGKSVAKTPLIRWKPAQEYVAPEHTIRAWWSQWPNANIGMATGKTSGVCVIDIDGAEALEEAKRLGLPMGGPTATTGRVGGRHIYCAWRDDAPTVFAKSNGIDFRGEGGYVVLPPSKHRSGASYTWALSPDEAKFPELPLWINELAATGRDAEYQAGHLDVGKLFRDGIPEGERDWDIFRVACKLRAVDVPIEVATLVLLELASRCRPPFSERETIAKVESAYRYKPGTKRYISYETVASPDANRDQNRDDGSAVSIVIRVEI
jgi:Bifunctional DNA primase/polymerase, N-terminal/Primase C terminal 1 (PriCT-1)